MLVKLAGGLLGILFLQIERWLKAGIDGHLVTGNQFIGLIGHADHGLEFFEHFWRHSFSKC